MRINVLVSCLEVSADHNAAFLIHYLNAHHPGEFHFLCIAGEEVKKIKQNNVEVINDLITLSNIGVFGNAKNFFTYLKFIRWFKNYLRKETIDAFLAIDGQGINVALGKIAHQNNLKTIYFFPPPVFTFGRRILKKMKYFDLIFCPFERDYALYKKAHLPAHYTGHPYHYVLKNHLFPIPKRDEPLHKLLNDNGGKKIIAIFPGSRPLEIERHTLVFLKAAKLIMEAHPEVAFVISLAHEHFRPYIASQLASLDLDIPIFHAYSDYIIEKSFFVFATSGTTTLKASFMGTPHVIAYKLDSLSYFIYRLLLRFKLMIYTPYIGTINVYQEKLITKELMNKDFSEEELINILERHLNDLSFNESKKRELLNVAKRFHLENPFEKIAETILRSLK